ncbi:LutC/YkgG family protein [Sutcliffiella cohnii]
MIQNRESFLDNIAKQLNRPKKTSGIARPMWKYQPQWKVLKDATQDELVEVLKKQCEHIHTNFVQATRSNLNERLREVVHELGGGPIVTWDDPRFTDSGIEKELNKWREDGTEVHVWDSALGEENINIAERANVGITFSDQTLAESGTVVLFSGNGKGRSVSLLPTTYIAIIPKSTIVPRMTQVAGAIHNQVENGKKIASCINFISGPSNSADIELNLVVGVHGPIKATYIVVEDL